MTQVFYKTIGVKEHPSLTRAVDLLQVLLHGISAAFMAAVQASLALSRILPIKSNKRDTWAERKYLPMASCHLKNGSRRFVPHNVTNLFSTS